MRKEIKRCRVKDGCKAIAVKWASDGGCFQHSNDPVVVHDRHRHNIRRTVAHYQGRRTTRSGARQISGGGCQECANAAEASDD